MLGSVAISVALFDLPFRGSVPALLLSSGTFLLAALGQGLLISSAAKNQFIAAMVALITGFLPAFLLSGFIFEIASMPLLVRALTHIIPARYLVTNLQTLFLVGDVWPLMLPVITSYSIHYTKLYESGCLTSGRTDLRSGPAIHCENRRTVSGSKG